MKKYKTIIGIDVSKSKLDLCFISDPFTSEPFFLVVSNDQKGISMVLKVLKRKCVDLNDALFCYENTGVYSFSLACSLDALGADYWEVPAIEIKRSKGITRGKSDKTDARDIAFYAHTHMHKLKLSKLPEKDLLKLKLLIAERGKLLKSIQIFEMTREIKGFIGNELTRDVFRVNRKTCKSLRKLLLEVEHQMQAITMQNPEINKQKELIQSVPGVGPQTAVYLIVITRGFQAFDHWRKMACYAGIAPFQYQSGSSIKGRTRVSHLADKKLKALLTMCALNAKKHDKEIAHYYKRKIEEGKNPMLVMNSIRCKVLSRVFAAVKRGQPYVNTYRFAA